MGTEAGTNAAPAATSTTPVATTPPADQTTTSSGDTNPGEQTSNDNAGTILSDATNTNDDASKGDSADAPGNPEEGASSGDGESAASGDEGMGGGEGEQGKKPDEGYDLTLEDSSPLTQDDLNAIAQEASDRGLTVDQAGELIKQREGDYSKGFDAYKANESARLKEASDAFNKDLDFVGDKKAESFASIRRAAQHFGDESLFKALNDPYIGNNLPLAKFLKKIGDALGPEGMDGKGGFGKGPEEGTVSSRLRNMYPEHFEDKK